MYVRFGDDNSVDRSTGLRPDLILKRKSLEGILYRIRSPFVITSAAISEQALIYLMDTQVSDTSYFLANAEKLVNDTSVAPTSGTGVRRKLRGKNASLRLLALVV